MFYLQHNQKDIISQFVHGTGRSVPLRQVNIQSLPQTYGFTGEPFIRPKYSFENTWLYNVLCG
jgi:hypothetical protein